MEDNRELFLALPLDEDEDDDDEEDDDDDDSCNGLFPAVLGWLLCFFSFGGGGGLAIVHLLQYPLNSSIRDWSKQNPEKQKPLQSKH